MFLSASLAYAASTLLYRITTALLKINNKLPFHSVYGYYRLYESQYKLYRLFRLHIFYKLYRLCGLDRLYRINKLMILIENEMKTHLFLKTFNSARHLLTQLLHFCTESRTALLKINTKLHFHSVYAYYRLYESYYKLYRLFRLDILYKL